MKKIMSFLFLVLGQFVLLASEGASSASDTTGYTSSSEVWSSETKTVLLVVFAVLCLWLAARTFRNKPEA
jgi:hypothetical protein